MPCSTRMPRNSAVSALPGMPKATVGISDPPSLALLDGLLLDPESGRGFELLSTKPAVQLYTANFLDGIRGAGGRVFDKHTALCLETEFYPDEKDFIPVPDPDAEGMEIVEYEMEPGDAVAFHFRVLHGARGNQATTRRRAFSLRLLGDDARYVTRPGRTSPPFPGHDMRPGERLREDWFPVLFDRESE